MPCEQVELRHRVVGQWVPGEPGVNTPNINNILQNDADYYYYSFFSLNHTLKQLLNLLIIFITRYIAMLQ